MNGWLAKTRVTDETGRRGTVCDEHPDAPTGSRFYAHPIVEWDDGQRTRMNAESLVRSPDDWLTRALNGDTP